MLVLFGVLAMLSALTKCKYMKKIRLFFVIAAIFSVLPFLASAQEQQGMSPEEREKKLDEFIQSQVEKMESTLKLEYWQVFYVDSIYNHDYRALQEELNTLAASKVSNYDIYTRINDKWAETTYNAIRKVLDDKQWEKYQKGGALRDKKLRDKRKAKIEAAAAKMKEND